MHEELPISDIIVRPQVRLYINPDSITELAGLIKASNWVNPVVVSKEGSKFFLVAGHRRLEACKILGRETIPAEIKTLTDDEVFRIQFAENMGRKDVSWFEQGLNIIARQKKTGEPLREIGRSIGWRSPQHANRLASAVSSLDPSVVQYIIECRRFDFRLDDVEALKKKTAEEQKRGILALWGRKETPKSQREPTPRRQSTTVPKAMVQRLLNQATEAREHKTVKALEYLPHLGPNPFTTTPSKKNSR